MNRGRVLIRLVSTILLAAVTSLVLSGTSSAHDVLIASSPEDGSTVSSIPNEVTFTFDLPVQNFDPVVSLVGPDGKQYATGTPSISGNVVTGTVRDGPAGAYIAAYRIVSADGHPVTGEVHFTLKGDSGVAVSGAAGSRAAATGRNGTGTGGPVTAGPTPGPTAATAVVAAGRPSSPGLSAGLWIGLIVAALVVIAAAVILIRRPPRGSAAGRDY